MLFDAEMMTEKMQFNVPQETMPISKISKYELGVDRLLDTIKMIFGVRMASFSLGNENKTWVCNSIEIKTKRAVQNTIFCQHTVQNQNLQLIEDTLLDERFKNHEIVTQSPNIRFYAGYPIKYMNGEKIGTVCMLNNTPMQLTETQQQIFINLCQAIENEINAFEISTQDELTSLPNRRGFSFLGKYSLKFSNRKHCRTRLVFFDIDNFKRYNDDYSHNFGDFILQSFATALKESIRSSDIAARWSGDEFVLMLLDYRLDDVEQLVTKIKTSMQQQLNKLDEKVEFDFSYGSSFFNPKEHQALDSLINECDHLMYQHKHRNELITKVNR